MRKSTPPEIKEVTGPMEGYEMSHPSFGAIQICRISSGYGCRLYGSSIDHQHMIQLSIHPSKVHRHLNQDWYHPSLESIVEIRMSATQFAEAITSLNSGGGTPCTIIYTDKDGHIPECQETRTPRTEVKQEFKQTCKEVAKALDDVRAQLASFQTKGAKAPTKADLESLAGKVNKAAMGIASTMPFITEQFDEACDDITAQAKGEIDAAFTHVLATLGGQKLQELLGMSEAPKIDGLIANGE